MRAVVDPNVIVAAAVAPSGTTARLLRAMFDRRFTMVVCPQLLDEVETVLRRSKFRRYLSVEQVEELVTAIEGAADEVDDPVEIEARTRDPNDDYLGCARGNHHR